MTSYRSKRTSIATRILGAAAVAVGSVAVIGAVVLAGEVGGSRGRIPDEAFREGAQQLDFSLVPDFVVALGRDGEPVGYVAKSALADPVIGPGGRPVVEPIPVVGEDLRTIVGYMYPSKGFVATGVDPDSVPDIPAELVSLPE